ncbi:MAG: hypothetical protein AAGA80_17975 [Cyanobacteria bacterium P01_F01_bin.143]
MTNPKIEVDIGEILSDIKNDQKEILKQISGLKDDISGLKVEMTEIRGDIKSLNTKVEQLDKRIANQEFTNRGVLIGLILAFVGSVVSMFSNA